MVKPCGWGTSNGNMLLMIPRRKNGLNARVTLRRWPYEMNSPAVSFLVQGSNPRIRKSHVFSGIETVPSLFANIRIVFRDIRLTALLASR